MLLPVAPASPYEEGSWLVPVPAGAGVWAAESVGVLSPVVLVPELGSENDCVTCAGMADAGATPLVLGAGVEGGSLGAIVPKPPPAEVRNGPEGVPGAAGAL